MAGSNIEVKPTKASTCDIVNVVHDWRSLVTDRLERCTNEVAYVYYHPDGQTAKRCQSHRWQLKRRKTQWQEHNILCMQR